MPGLGRSVAMELIGTKDIRSGTQSLSTDCGVCMRTTGNIIAQKTFRPSGTAERLATGKS
ncbi:hypothetical protein TYRP_022921 [Tyrophagus putrescentiae]|nr:hypothetical protein TYRP_022921 [Tyrophagus putrescentiae]